MGVMRGFLTAGMVGCVRKMELGGEEVDLRSLVGTDVAHKDATYDDCRVSVAGSGPLIL